MNDLVEQLRGIGTPLGNTVFGYHRGDMKRAGEAAAEIAKICFAAADALVSATPPRDGTEDGEV